MSDSSSASSTSNEHDAAAARRRYRMFALRWRLANAFAALSLKVAPEGPAKELLARLYAEYSARIHHELRYCKVMAFRPPALPTGRAHTGEQESA